MKSFGQFITERRSTPINFEEALDLIEENCQDMIENVRNDYYIWRGFSSSDPAATIDPKQFERKSANTSNIYTMIMDHSALWKGYPDRSKSIVCTSNFSKAEGHGTPHLIFPYDGSKIGIAPTGDIWTSFLNQLNNEINMPLALDKLNIFIGDIIQKTYNWLKSHEEYEPNFELKKATNDWNELNKFNRQLNSLSEKEKHDILDNLVKADNMFEAFLNSSMDDFINWIDKKLLDPDESGFKVVTTSSYETNGEHEVWTNGKSIMLSHEYINRNEEAQKEFQRRILGKDI